MTNSNSSSQSKPEDAMMAELLPIDPADRVLKSVDRRQAQTLREASEHHDVSLVETLPVGIFRTDASGKGIYHNNCWYQIAGVTPEAARGKGWIESIHPEDRDRVPAEWQKSIQEHRPFQLEYRFQRADGQVTWVYGQAQAERDINGQIIGYVGTLTDISIRKQAEIQLQILIEGTAATTGKDYFPVLASHIAKALNVSYALVTEKVDDKLSVLAFWAKDSLQSTFAFQIADTPCQKALQQGKYYCESLVQEKFPTDLDLVEMRAESYLGIALQDAQGKAIGNLCILNENPIQDPQKAENLLRVFAARAAAELERERADQALARLNQELEQRVAERTAALQKSEQRYRALMDGASDAILLSTLEGYCIEANYQAESLLSYSRSELTNLHRSQIHPPTALAAVQNHFSRITQNGMGGILETSVLDRDGRQVPVEITASLIDLGGEQVIQAIFRDITERKQTKLALELEVLRRNAIFNASSDGIHIMDREGNLIEANDRFAQMLGYTPAEIVGFTVFDWDAQWSRAELAEVIKNDSLDETTFETLHRRKNGSVFPVEISRRTMVWQGKSFLVNISRDITERKQTAAALQASEAELRSLFMGMDDVVLVFDRIGTYLKVVSTSPEKLIAAPDILLGNNIQDFFASAQATQFLVTIERTLATQQTQECEYSLTIDRIDYWFNAKCSPLDALSVIWVARDISNQKALLVERQEYQSQLEYSNAELLQATRLKDEFLANMSHELRTPLNAILGLSESFLAEVFGVINQRQIKAISTIESSGEHLLSLINDILEVSKIEAGEMELELTTVSATTLTNSTLAFVKQLAHQKQIHLTTTFAHNIGNIDVDERRIRQVLINLLNNAVKFTPAGGQVTLDVQLEQPEFCPLSNPADLREQLDSGGWILFVVTDTGIGITAENQSKLFKPFIQIDGSLNRQYQGTGLGLTLVKQIVELHGGSVSLASEFGQGSCFTVRLPYDATVEPQTISSSETSQI
jgi:PAS domain S-box-containing protein